MKRRKGNWRSVPWKRKGGEKPSERKNPNGVSTVLWTRGFAKTSAIRITSKKSLRMRSRTKQSEMTTTGG